MSRFLDTNVLVYAFVDDRRTERARQLLAEANRIAVQSLNEFTLVALRRFCMSWPLLLEALATICALCPPPLPLTIDINEVGSTRG